MSHKDVEQIISRAVVDEQFRELLFTSPNEALRAPGAPGLVTREVRQCARRSRAALGHGGRERDRRHPNRD